MDHPAVLIKLVLKAHNVLLALVKKLMGMGRYTAQFVLLVQGKVEQECNRVLSLVTACLTDGPGKVAALDELKTERGVLKNKIMAVSDLLAVFRAA